MNIKEKKRLRIGKGCSCFNMEDARVWRLEVVHAGNFEKVMDVEQGAASVDARIRGWER